MSPSTAISHSLRQNRSFSSKIVSPRWALTPKGSRYEPSKQSPFFWKRLMRAHQLISKRKTERLTTRIVKSLSGSWARPFSTVKRAHEPSWALLHERGFMILYVFFCADGRRFEPNETKKRKNGNCSQKCKMRANRIFHNIMKKAESSIFVDDVRFDLSCKVCLGRIEEVQE